MLANSSVKESLMPKTRKFTEPSRKIVANPERATI